MSTVNDSGPDEESVTPVPDTSYDHTDHFPLLLEVFMFAISVRIQGVPDGHEMNRSYLFLKNSYISVFACDILCLVLLPFDISERRFRISRYEKTLRSLTLYLFSSLLMSSVGTLLVS